MTSVATPTEQYVKSLSAKKRGMERIALMRKAKWYGLTSPDYVQRGDGGEIEAVRCKKCGKVVKANGAELSSYIEEELHFDDRSRHITPLCQRCGQGLSMPELEALYCADLQDLRRDEEAAGMLMYWELLADRKIIGHARYK